eukprot:8429177-Prorocentrum_lima.AAC.1
MGRSRPADRTGASLGSMGTSAWCHTAGRGATPPTTAHTSPAAQATPPESPPNIAAERWGPRPPPRP